ncbi:MAG: DUF423 domain-containing protein [Bermanella sp.]
MKSNKILLVVGASLAALSVLMGAFASHALKAQLSEQALGWIATGVQYQMFHALMILILAFALQQWPNWAGLKAAAYSFIMGILMFSGSLYFMAITDIRTLAIITPIGGLAFLGGWGLLIWAACAVDTVFGNQDDR